MCSIAEAENDDVVEKVVLKAGESVSVCSDVLTSVASTDLKGKILRRLITRADRTRYGWLILPDRSGWGPMYVAVLKKTARLEKRRKVNKYKAFSKAKPS